MKKRINLTEALKVYRSYVDEMDTLKTCKRVNPEKDYSEKETVVEELRQAVVEASKAIRLALDLAQYRCSARTITAWDILCMVGDIEDKLSISKRAMEGCSFKCDMNAQLFPNAYKYVPSSTKVILEVHSGKWYLTDIYRGETKRIHFEATLTDVAKEAIIKNCERF